MISIRTNTRAIVCFITCISFLMLSSCTKEWLNEKTNQNITTPTSLKDFQAMLDDFSLNQGSPYIGQVGSNESYITDVNYLAQQDIEKNAYTWTHQRPYLQVVDWTRNYTKIMICNIILEGLEKIKPASEIEQQSYNDVKGQALFQRARTFYELAQIWAPVYNSSTAATDLSVPLRAESDINIPSKQSTVQQTYNRIIEDLIEARNLLPFKAVYTSRSSKIATDALLARIYLSMEEYAKARERADACLNNYGDLMEFSDLVASQSAPISNLNREIIFYSVLGSSTALTSNQLRIRQEFKNLYEPNDLRNTVFYGTSGGLITFKGNYTGSANVRFNGLATDEIYLIRAECYARDKRIIEAMRDLNTLLRTRWRKTGGISSYINQTASDADDALRKILLERKKELLIRGLRWSDLRRLNLDDRFKETLSRTVAGQTYIIEPNSYKYTFPIPDDIIQMTGFQQNPGWNN